MGQVEARCSRVTVINECWWIRIVAGQRLDEVSERPQPPGERLSQAHNKLVQSLSHIHGSVFSFGSLVRAETDYNIAKVHSEAEIREQPQLLWLPCTITPGSSWSPLRKCFRSWKQNQINPTATTVTSSPIYTISLLGCRLVFFLLAAFPMLLLHHALHPQIPGRRQEITDTPDKELLTVHAGDTEKLWLVL